MSYPLRYAASTWYKVHVEADGDRRILVDTYNGTANAVFGALRKLESDRSWNPDPDAIVRLYALRLPPKPPSMSKAAYTRLLREQHRL